MLPKTDWATLIPHQGSMCLLDWVVRYDADNIEALAESHHSPDNPLRRDGQLHAVHLCEYGAQAMALHGGLMARAAGTSARPGYLVVLRDVEFEVMRIDNLPAAIDIHAERLAGDAHALHYAFRIEHQGAALAAGRALVMLRD